MLNVLSFAIVINIILTFPCVSELSRLKDEEISAAAIKAQFEKQLLTERTLKTQVGVINSKEDFEIFFSFPSLHSTSSIADCSRH